MIANIPSTESFLNLYLHRALNRANTVYQISPIMFITKCLKENYLMWTIIPMPINYLDTKRHLGFTKKSLLYLLEKCLKENDLMWTIISPSHMSALRDRPWPISAAPPVCPVKPLGPLQPGWESGQHRVLRPAAVGGCRWDDTRVRCMTRELLPTAFCFSHLLTHIAVTDTAF